jgi:hypothetical protein
MRYLLLAALAASSSGAFLTDAVQFGEWPD